MSAIITSKELLETIDALKRRVLVLSNEKAELKERLDKYEKQIQKQSERSG